MSVVAASNRDEARMLRLDQILVPEDRLRPMDETAAERLAELIQEQGQLSPIIVYHSSGAARPYTLIAGARRYRAMELLGSGHIAVVLRSKDEAPMLEITDNFAAPNLTELERSDIESAFRSWWQERHGEIGRGGDRKSKRHDVALILPNYFNDLFDKFGISKRVANRLNKISASLEQEVKAALRNTPVADDQSKLLRIARMEPYKRRAFASAVRSDGFDAAWTALKPSKVTSKQKLAFDAFVTAWARMNDATRRDAMAALGLVKP